ncbi:hypothetical protein LDENG_00262790, partial [Lucifuga dentata]
MEVTEEPETPEDHSDSEDQDYYYYSPGQKPNTDLVETRVLTRSEPIPSRERQMIKERSWGAGSSVEVHPAPVNPEGKESLVARWLEGEKRCSSTEGAADRCPVELTPLGVENSPTVRGMESVELAHSGVQSPLTLGIGTSTELSPNRLENPLAEKGILTAVERKTVTFPDSESEPDSSKARKVSFGKILEIPSDISDQRSETSTVHPDMLDSNPSRSESPSDEPDVMDGSLPVSSDLSMRDSSMGERSLGSEPGQEESVERSHDCAEAEILDGRTTPPTHTEE